MRSGVRLLSERYSTSDNYISLNKPAAPYGDSALVFDELSSKPVILPYIEAAVLSKLTAFASLEEHAASVAAVCGPSDLPFIAQSIKNLLDKKLLISGEEYLAALEEKHGQQNSQISPNPVESFVWVTADRPEKLLKSVKSFSRLFHAAGRFPTLTVYDDSRNAASSAKTRQEIEALKADSGAFPLSILHFGKKEKTAFTGSIGKTIKGKKAVMKSLDFALTGEDGANRNLAFLHQAGNIFVSTDDDTEGMFAPHPAPRSQIELSSEQDPSDLYIYSSRKEVLENANPVQMDILLQHEKLLGKKVSEICLKTNTGFSFYSADPVTLCRLFQKDFHITCTLSGICGDSGMTHSKAVLTGSGSNSGDIYTDEKYERVRLFREILRLVPAPVISTGQFYMSTHTGFDNRVIPLPFFPKFRSADGLFGFLRSRVFENQATGFIPFAVFHNPDGQRVTPESSLTMWQPGTADILAILASDFILPSCAMSNEDRIESLGRYYSAFHSMDDEELIGYIKSRYLPYTIDYMNILERNLRESVSMPVKWVEDVNTIISYMENHLDDSDFYIPSELRKSHDNMPPLQLLREYAYSFGELLKAWPEIWHASLKATGK